MQKKPLQKVAKERAIIRRSNGSMIETIKERQTEELVVALCGSLGSGTSTIASKLSEIFSTEYGYPVKIIKISDLIEKHVDFVLQELKQDNFITDEYIGKIDFSKNIDWLDKSDRIALLQSAGNLLRKKYSKDVLAQLVINEIALERDREESEGKTVDGESAIDTENEERKSRRHITIIDSLKNPSEVKLLQIVYRNMFFLFGVLCPEEIRGTRLIYGKKIEQTKANQLMVRDKSEDEKYGQQLLKTIYHSEFFITNSNENIDSLKPNLTRYIRMIMGDKSVTPTKEENAMFHAQSAAVRSGCLSRQVGASIIDKDGNLISTGCNDVPKANGGLYTTEDGEDDSRCMFKYGGKCINQDEKENIFNEIDSILKAHLQSGDAIKKISEEIRKNQKLQSLIEFCRAIHAEMDAITSVARNGGVSLKGASLFSTTFPCHNCARHIVAAGIKRVYYIEPYEKSLALRLHKDSISFDKGQKESTDNNKVAFIPFEGVSPRKYLRLFQAEDRKKDGVRITEDPKTVKPALPVLLETRYEYESKIVENLVAIGFLEADGQKLDH